jgi:hypothetical protein
MSVKLVILFFQAVVLVAGFLRDRQAKGVGREQALRDIQEMFRDKIAAANRAADRVRVQPDNGLHDIFDKDS